MSFFGSIVGKGDNKNHIVFEGDSWNDVNYMTSLGGTALPVRLISNIGGESVNFNTVNYSAAGYAISNISTAAGGGNTNMQYKIAAVLNQRNANRWKDIAILFEGLNELGEQTVYGSGATGTYNAWLVYIRALVAKGFKVIFNSCPNYNFSSSSYTAIEAQRIILNNNLRVIFNVPTGVTRCFTSNDYSLNGVIMCDLGADPLCGQPDQSNNTTYFLSGALHPKTVLTNYIVDNYYYPCIKEFN